MREIVLGNDNAAVELKITIAAYLRSLGVRVEDSAFFPGGQYLLSPDSRAGVSGDYRQRI